jgi:hypothetical protein
MLSQGKSVLALLAAVVLSVPAWGAGTNERTPAPGTLNYIEGQASIGSEALSTKSAGNAEVDPGQTLATQNGRAEMLLTPGIFLRLDHNSAVKMISPSLTDTQMAVVSGRAMVEVDQLFKANDISIHEGNATARLLKTGLYEFDAGNHEIRVFDGQAMVNANDERVRLKGGHEVALNENGTLKAQKFDRKQEENSGLYRFSSLRSDYLAEASSNAAQVYVAGGWGLGWFGPGWGPGWWWSPWFGGYTFFPAAGYLYSPFGYGFYSPVWLRAHPGAAATVHSVHPATSAFRSVGPREGFHGESMMSGIHSGGAFGGGMGGAHGVVR